MNEKEKHIHDTAMKIVKILIESGLPITHQLQVLKNVRAKLDFCQKVGAESKQKKLEL